MQHSAEAVQRSRYQVRSFCGGVMVVTNDPGDFPGAILVLPEMNEARLTDALGVFRREGSDLDWTFLSPPALIEPGERTGKFRLGGDQLLTDDRGRSRISAEDYAIALLDEVENPKHIRQRFTVAY